MPEPFKETISYPPPFWLCLAIMAVLGVYFFVKREEGWGIPALAVLATVAVWYIGDALYNDYAEYLINIGQGPMEEAWWEVGLFLCAFGIVVRPFHRQINRRCVTYPSRVLNLMWSRSWQGPAFQKQIDIACRLLAGCWLVLMGIALVRVEFDFTGLFMPYLGHKSEPWSRARLGGGFDAFIALAGYLQVMLTAIFGVIAAIAQRPSTRNLSLVIFGLSAPYFLLDRTRNTILVSMVPGFLAFAFLRMRGGIFIRLLVLIVGFLVMNQWLKFIMDTRVKEMSVAHAFSHGEFNIFGKAKSDEPSEVTALLSGEEEDVKHQGINMFAELSWMNYFIANGSYLPNWGQRYFAELVNPIPRALWPGKPLIGMDYAVARGFAWEHAEEGQGGVAASVSTGMIGQGVNNFGRFFGPIAAAILMAIWVAVLARQDLMGYETPRLLLYALGMVLTFNMGRDITLLVIYPFIFGYILFVIWKKFQGRDAFSQSR